MFRKDSGNVTRHRIRSSGSNFPADSGDLIFRQTDGDLQSGHTMIIPLASRRPELALLFLKPLKGTYPYARISSHFFYS
jgi:hypothetical protein